MPTRLLFSFLSVFLVCTLANCVLYAAEGDVDPFFLTGPGFGFSSDDPVYDMAVQADGKVVAVGYFLNAVGAGSRRLVRLNVDGSVDTTFRAGTGGDNTIDCVRIQPDGKILLGGFFLTFNRVTVNRLVRLNQDGSIDSSFDTNGGASGPVLAIDVQQDGKILVGGNFATFGGTAANKIVRLNTDGSVDQSFLGTSDIIGIGAIHEIVVQDDGKVLIGGDFGMSDNDFGIARLLGNGSWDTGFSATVGGFEGVRSIKIAGSRIFIGGGFNTVNAAPRIGYAGLSFTGALDGTFAVTGNVPVTRLAVQADGKIIITSKTFGTNNIRRVDSSGGTDPTFTANEPEPIHAVAVQSDGKVIIGGRFGVLAGVGGARPTGVVRLNSTGTRDPSFVIKSGAPNDGVFEYAVQPDGKVLVLGQYTLLGNLPRTRFGRLNSDGTVDDLFVPAVNDHTAFGVQPDGKIIVAGYRFGMTGTFPIRRLNSDGTIDPGFVAESTTDTSSENNRNIEDVAIQSDGKILVAGNFIAINGVPKKGIVRLLSNGAIDSTFNPSVITPGMEFVIVERVIVQPDGKIWIAGSFRDNPSRVIAVFRLTSEGAPETFTQISSPVGGDNIFFQLVQQFDGKILIAGNFSGVHSFQTRWVGRINYDGTPDTTFAAPVVTGGVNPGAITAIAPLRSGRVLVGGGFSTIGGVTKTGLARLHADGTVDTSYTIDVSGGTNSSNVDHFELQPDGNILVSGNFKLIGGDTHELFARLLNSPQRSTLFDFDGDGKTDVGIFRPNVAEWWINRSSDGNAFATQFGVTTDKIVPADYTGDGKGDIAIWRPASGEWFVLRSEDFSFYSFPFGMTGDTPVPGDYDSDGEFDAAVFRPSTGTWFIRRSSDGGATVLGFGTNGDLPVPGDYDGDNKTDIAIFRPSAGQWWLNRSTDGVIAVQFGNANDKAVQGDYTGDGKSDVAFWRPSTGEWYVLRSENFSFFAFPFGTLGDTPAPGDYDGDGRHDATVFRPASSTWYSSRSTAGMLIVPFGTTGDLPIPSAFVP